MRPIDAQLFRLLQVYVAIADAGSLTGAAERLGLSRSAVSLNLRDLEERLDVRLIERTTRRMALTQVGERVLDEARTMCGAAESALRVAADEAGSVRGTLRIACPVGLAESVLLPIIERLRQAHPALHVDLRASDGLEDLVGDGIDVALRLGTPQDSSFIMRRWQPATEILCAAPDLAARWADAPSPLALLEAPWVVHGLVHRSVLHFETADGRDTCRLRAPATVASTETRTVLACARRGLGIMLMPDLLVVSDLRAGHLVRLLPDWQGRSVQLYSLHASRGPSARRDAFFDALRTHLAAPTVEL